MQLSQIIIDNNNDKLMPLQKVTTGTDAHLLQLDLSEPDYHNDSYHIRFSLYDIVPDEIYTAYSRSCG